QDKSETVARMRAPRPLSPESIQRKEREAVALSEPGSILKARRAPMEGMRCCLRDSMRDCGTHPGMCCRVCTEWSTCDKACLNSPERCGQACNIDTRHGHGAGAKFVLRRPEDGKGKMEDRAGESPGGSG